MDYSKSEYLGVKAFYNRYAHEISLSSNKFYMLWKQDSDKYFNKYLKWEITFEEQRLERIKEIYTYFGINLLNNDAKIRFSYYLISMKKNG